MWKCNNKECGYESNRYFGICSKCRKGEGTEQSISKDNNSQSPFSTNDYEYSGPPILERAKKVNPDEKADKASFKTQYPGLNSMISSASGFIDSQVLLIGASPGVGKSTLCLSIANEETLYIGTEENYKQINQRALRINPDTGCLILSTNKISDVLEAINKFQGKVVIIDSLNGIEFGVGYQTVAKFANEITKAVKSSGKIGIITSQVARTGEIIGANSISHIVDSVFHLEKSHTSSDIIAASSKNRFGEIGSVAIFQHRPNGFVEINIDNTKSEKEIGSTYTNVRFGHKVIKISIEALVADSQSNYGVRKSNGYNQNRLMQLIGILSYYGRLNLNLKDVYVAISNGLYTDDVCIELAMANSILSSYYNKALIREAYGEIRLNGKINNGTIDGQEIHHINNLISLYKKG